MDMKNKPKQHIADQLIPQEFLEAMMQYIPEGIAIADARDMSIHMVSKFGMDLLGNSKEKIEGISCTEFGRLHEICHPDGVTQAKAEELPLTRATLKGDVAINEEWVVRRSDGKKLNLLCNSGPILDRDGNLIAGIVLWRDVTERKLKEEELRINNIAERRDMEEELQAKSNRLLEVNSALKALLRQRDEDRKEFEEAVLTNIENLIMPYVKRMKHSTLSSSQASLLEILESHLKELTSKFGKTLALEYRVLTPTEMRVAALVRDGKTSKEIAELLCISEKTASFHRNNIRTKLGLRGMGANLRSHLLTLT
jgi:PAS domain S-box-containing protein